MFAEVVLSKVTKHIDKIYHYVIPEALKDKLEVGSAVKISFGKRTAIGYVVGFVEKSEFRNLKEIIDLALPEPLFDENHLQLARWIADHYCSFFGSALRLFLPIGKQVAGRGSRVAGQGNKLELTEEQSAAVAKIEQAIDKKQTDKFLLYGITGSGKTEVYLQTIEYLLNKGKNAIVLVPEIGLTPQLVQRFQERFGDQIAVLHSGLKEKERNKEWWRVASGDGRIVLGTRLALFAPIKNLGLIVIDEEYENTYKSEKSPRYHARDVALKLGELCQIPVVLGSATPALETFYKAETGEYQKLVLSKRIDDRPLPPVEIIDMREELKHKNFSMLSGLLRQSLEETLRRGEQAILFINRRGYFTFVMCRQCGKTITCPNCHSSLIYYSKEVNLRCNLCNYQVKTPPLCPNCESSMFKYFGGGTQRLEEEVAKLFPDARIIRVDRDTVSKKGSHDEIFATFSQGKADILIGTQMVTKGLDLASVTLVGVVAADAALNIPDFRAAERTFQLITQVAGRAGRHYLPGQVIVQTYNPDHFAIKAAAKHNYEEFYQQEIAERRELNYPPFTKLISIMVTDKKAETALKGAEELVNQLNLPGVLGPVPAAIPKLRGEWRYQILIKTATTEIVVEALRRIIDHVSTKVIIDVEPTG